MCKIIYFLLLPAGLCSIAEAALRSRPPRPRVALEWKGQTGRHQVFAQKKLFKKTYSLK